MVEIEDVNKDFKKEANNPELVVPKAALPNHPSDERDFAGPTQPMDEYAEKQDITAPPAPVAPGTTVDVPIHGEKTNILFHATPTLSLSDTVFAGFEQKATILCAGIFGTILVLGKMLGGGSIWALILISAGVSGGVWYWCQGVMHEARTVDWESEKKRGETANQNLIPESVEWMNSLLGLVWSLVNPEMFSALQDTLEDVMQASLPGFIENVRVAEMSQGTNPIRILSLRALPDTEVPELKMAATAARDGMDEQQRKAEEDGGEVYNLEIAFAYNAAPVDTKSLSGKTRNMHMQLVFYAGIPGLVGVPLPIWVELKGLVGTVRLRIQISPDSPFLKTLTFTLMGIPQVSVSCIPMVEKGINILNLPMISNFVNASIATAANEYVAPKSMSLEIGKMLMGDDVKKETEALGILWVNIHKATGLSKQDRTGSSDPYITLAFSKYGKPMYSTRVIVDDLNPIWNESTGILIRSEHIKAGEALSVELWDSDRFTADDLVGKCEIPIQDLMVHSGKTQDYVSKLSGEESGSTMPGELHWSVTFFGKTQFRPALRTSGKDVNLPPQLKDHPELQDDKGQLDTAEEDAVMHTPPDPLWPSGIVSVIVHQIVNLEVRDQTGTYGKRKDGKEYSPGMKTGESVQEEGGKLPSSYCTITLNDQLIYRTRSKVLSSKPIFNAGTERFIRDWRSAIVTVSVRDQRQREHDPLLGVVPLKLSDILQTSSEVTRWFPLDGGLGFGQIRISILFRSVDLTLPPPLLGWEVGTFEFLSHTISASLSKPAKLKFRTGGSVGKIPRKSCHITQAGGIEWSTAVGRKNPRPLRLPVLHRYMSPICIDIYTSSSSRKPDCHAMIWLDKLVDNERTSITVPIWSTNNPQRLSQNYIETPGQHPELDVKEIGTMTFEGRFQPGMDRDHARFATDNDSRETYETWEACRGEGIRGDTVYTETNAVIDELHKKSVREMRHDLVKTDKGMLGEEEEKKFTDKYGMNWREVFEAAHVELGGEEEEEVRRRKLGPLDPPVERYDDYGYDTDYSETSTSPSDDESDDSYHHITSSQYVEHGQDGNEVHQIIPRTNDGDAVTRTHDKSSGPIAALKDYRENQKGLHRKHRGLMQWKPMRSLAFAKDEAKFGARKLRDKVKLHGREPDVETEV
ncbi:hypothetical protein FPQ18DRAFT_271877 [Pyronema domesticum]|nr:hypothetical protein FPQ18DRAFT_271877 [Pyronema domesticum]